MPIKKDFSYIKLNIISLSVYTFMWLGKFKGGFQQFLGVIY